MHVNAVDLAGAGDLVGFPLRTREVADRLVRAAGAVLRDFDGMQGRRLPATPAEEKLRCSMELLRMAVTHYLRTT